MYAGRLKASAVSAFWIVVMLILLYKGVAHQIGVEPWTDVKENHTLSAAHRKLLQEVESPDPDFNRIGPWRKCSQSDIQVNQGQTSPLPNGIPTYTVIVMNTCPTGCAIGGIHLSCGWFSSARLINPSVFKRIGYDDCLVNDGNSLPGGATLSFQYANTFSYPLSVSSVSC